MLYLPTMDEETHSLATEALDAFGMDAVDRFCGNLVAEADTFETTGPETSEGYARITLNDSDRVALVILNAADRAGRHYAGQYSYERNPATIDESDTLGNWAKFTEAIVFWDDRGFYYPDFFATKEEADAQWEKCMAHCAEGWTDEEGDEA